MKNFFLTCLLALSLSFLSACDNANAQAPSFDNVTVSYQTNDLSFDKTDGVSVAVSKTVGDVLFVSGSASRIDANRSDLDTYRVGLGARFGFSNDASAYVLGYGVRANLDYSAPNLSDFNSYGYGVEGGVRANILPGLEVRGGAATERLTANSDWTTYALVGTSVNLTKSIALVGDARLHSDANQYNLGLRYQF